MDDSNSNSHSLSVPQSLRSETKEKFDALLKNALKKKTNQEQYKSKEKLLSDHEDSTTASSEHLVDETAGTTFILNKFFNSDNAEQKIVKPPVPKPRKITKSKNGSVSSHATFNVPSPKFLKRNQANGLSKTQNCDKLENSDSSQGTFNVTSPKFAKPNETKDRQNIKTNVKVENKIGDVILHDSPKGTKITIVDSSKQSGSDEESQTDNKAANGNSVADEIQNVEPKKDYKNIMEILVHKTDKLLIKSFLIHPVVNLHIVNIKNGKYFAKSDKSRNVIFYYENQDTDYILPVMTHCYNLQEKRTLYPSWEEAIIINEDFEYLASENVIYFFEVLDFQTISKKTNKRALKDPFKGWYKICFAFIKPIGKNNARNLDKKLRLQLYYINENLMKFDGGECYLWNQWKSAKLKKYPSTIYVTIKSIKAPDNIIQAIRSKTPLQQEHSTANLFEDEVAKENENQEMSIYSELSKKSWLKTSDKYQIPNKFYIKLFSYDEGCFVHKFSHSGKYLAGAVKICDIYYVVIYADFKEKKKYSCHQGLIYGIVWSKNDSLIITCSADNTIAIWDFANNCFLQILPHPTFVYTCSINCNNVIASGCFDGFIRLWMEDENKEKYDLFEELPGHEGFLTSICFNKRGNLMYSASSTGQIFIWENLEKFWKIKEYLNIFELKNVIINKISLFPNEKKLFVHSRDSTPRIVSLKSQVVLHWLHGSLNERVQMGSAISPCGNYVISGSENGIVTIWNAKTGEIVKTYGPFDEKVAVVHCVDCHPNNNMFTVSCQSIDSSIYVYAFEESESDCDKNKIVIESVPKTRCKFESKIDFNGILQKMDDILH